MPIRFRKSFKILPWFKVNVSKSGISETVGSKGFHLTFNKRGVRQSVGLPGTGLSESSYIVQNEHKAEHAQPSQPVVDQAGVPTSKAVLLLIGMIAAICMCLGGILLGLVPSSTLSQWISSLHP